MKKKNFRDKSFRIYFEYMEKKLRLYVMLLPRSIDVRFIAA